MSCRRGSCLREFNACLPRLSIGTAKVESRLFSRWIPRMPVVGRSVGPPVIWRKGAGCGARGGQCSFFRGTGRRLLVLQHRYRGGECPRAAKGGCCFLGTGRSPGRTGSGDCVVISLHLRLFGPMSGRRKGEKERESARREGAYRTGRKETRVAGYREKERNIIVVRASVGARCPIRAHSGWLCGSRIGERERRRAFQKCTHA